jgi:cytochrome c oxidase assembly factor CtaG
MLLLFVMSRVVGIASSNTARIIIFVAGITVCSFATASAIAVLSHLKKNKIALYEEEINNSQ